jgi:CHAD domain-containing protein
VESSLEREVKLSAAPAFRLPDLSGLAEGVEVGPEREVRLETTYYDTGDLRLARWGLSLRYRGGEGWTLKLPGSVSGPGKMLARGEVTFPGPPRRPPEEAAALVRAYVRGSALEPMARLSTRRRRLSLSDGDGHELIEVVDDEVSVLDGRRVAARFREVEVELRDGGDAVLPGVLERLRQAGAATADPMPKHLRALGPAALLPAEVAVRELPARPTAGDVVRNALAAATALVLRHDPLVRLGGDPEDVHQARVGTRRMRSHLRTFAPLLDRGWTDGLRQELGWLAGELGAVRDAEVLMERLRALARRLPEVDTRAVGDLLGGLASAQEEHRRGLLEAMSGQLYVDLLERLVAAAAAPRFSGATAKAPASQVLPALAVKPWRALRRAVLALETSPPDEALHQVRILAKRTRYAAEAVAPAAGPDAARFAKLVAELQDVLGEHQDSATASTWLRASAAAGGRRRAFVAGELSGLEAGVAADARRRWPDVWARIDRPKLRAWMPH